MSVNVVPAVLGNDLATTKQTIRRLSLLRSGLHLDVLDGTLFGRRKNLIPEDLQHLRIPSATTVHLMVKRPSEWLHACANKKIRQVVLHVESDLTPQLLKEAGKYFHLILAIAPGTNEKKLSTLAAYSQGFQVMTVRPGKQGAAFERSQLSLIRKLRKQFPRKRIIVDGSVNTRTIQAIVDAGANEVVVGSALTSAKDPRRSLRELRSQIA